MYTIGMVTSSRGGALTHTHIILSLLLWLQLSAAHRWKDCGVGWDEVGVWKWRRVAWSLTDSCDKLCFQTHTHRHTLAHMQTHTSFPSQVWTIIPYYPWDFIFMSFQNYKLIIERLPLRHRIVKLLRRWHLNNLTQGDGLHPWCLTS